MKTRILIVVTHLLGVGHLVRMVHLARALQKAGGEIKLVSGGRPSRLIDGADIDIIQLPPVYCIDNRFESLFTAEGRPIDNIYADQRINILLKCMRSFQPHVLITELFPFGRRKLLGEFNELIIAAHKCVPRPLIISSIRDILGTPIPKRVEWTHSYLHQFYDSIMVHGDPDFIELQDSWPLEPKLLSKVTYTGYIRDTRIAPDLTSPTEAEADVVVSSGGSDMGISMLRVAVNAARIDPMRLRWLVLVSDAIGSVEFNSLVSTTLVCPRLKVERVRGDFFSVLRNARVSVSQAGYNTVVDIWVSGTNAVLVPVGRDTETEQKQRAALLNDRGMMDLLPEIDLTPERLVNAVGRAIERKREVPNKKPKLNGAEIAAQYILSLKVNNHNQ